METSNPFAGRASKGAGSEGKAMRYARFAWTVLAYNLGVVAWGAYVRATGSGAGCGQHWPTCQGEIVPHAGATATMIEYSHRLSSGLALILTVGLVVGAFRTFANGHPARRGAVMAAVFMVLEAALGAALVMFGLVAGDASLARGVVMPVHMVNTFLLLGSMALTAWWASGGADFRLRGQGMLGPVLGLGMAGMMVLGISGAITALGDTLFHMTSLSEGWRQDFAPAAHIFVRLRILHPTIATVVGLYLAGAGLFAAFTRKSRPVFLLGGALVLIFAVQFAVGIVNMLLMAPVPMQLVHLLLADLTWISLVLLTAASFAAQPATASAPVPVIGPARA
jgi:heme A synthase